MHEDPSSRLPFAAPELEEQEEAFQLLGEIEKLYAELVCVPMQVVRATGHGVRVLMTDNTTLVLLPHAHTQADTIVKALRLMKSQLLHDLQESVDRLQDVLEKARPAKSSIDTRSSEQKAARAYAILRNELELDAEIKVDESLSGSDSVRAWVVLGGIGELECRDKSRQLAVSGLLARICELVKKRKEEIDVALGLLSA